MSEPEQEREHYALGFLTVAEAREKATQELAQVKLATNASARRLAIMQEHQRLMERANAITKAGG